MSNQVTTQAANAFMKAVPFKSKNTTVTIEEVDAVREEKLVVLRYHGHAIAQRVVGSNEIMVTNAGYFTNTTKARLNGIPGVSVNQKAFVWFLNGEEWNGEWKTV